MIIFVYISIYRTKYSRMCQVEFVEDSLQKILLGPFLNTLSHIYFRTSLYSLLIVILLIS